MPPSARRHAFARRARRPGDTGGGAAVERGETLHFHKGYRYAVFPRRGGRWPELGTTTRGSGSGGFWAEFTRWAVRCLSGSGPELSIQDLGRRRRRRFFVLDGDWMPDYLADNTPI